LQLRLETPTRVLPRSAIVELERDDVVMGDKLGDGASGDVFAATLDGQAVAVKVCRGRVLATELLVVTRVGSFSALRCEVTVHLALELLCFMTTTSSARQIFKSDVSPDGRAADEIAVTCAVDHPTLIKVVGGMAEPHALVVVRVSCFHSRLFASNRNAHHLGHRMCCSSSALWSQLCRCSQAEQGRAVVLQQFKTKPCLDLSLL
jgi:hypothetical protein